MVIIDHISDKKKYYLKTVSFLRVRVLGVKCWGIVERLIRVLG